MSRVVRGAVVMVLLMVAAGVMQVAAEPIGDPAFQRTWERTDKPVADGRAVRTWMWGPEAYSEVLTEDYAESPGGVRRVQYFDKSRMEITDPAGDQSSIWYVTNGLLVVELMSGRMQVGNDEFSNNTPAAEFVAGDVIQPAGISYALFGETRDDPAYLENELITGRVERQAGELVITTDDSKVNYNIRATHYVAETRHRVAAPFWEFMNASGLVYQDGQFVNDRLFVNPFYATGLPITEAYWASVIVGGQPRDVLLQCFERRCLTYTPDNPAEWRVEMGNVGQHYYRWRYTNQQPGEIVTVQMVEPANMLSWTFSPNTVTIKAGDSVRFVNAGAVGHTATADNGEFDTGFLSSGEVAVIRFDTPGTYPYYCAPHPWMRGTIIVEPR